MDTLQKAIRYDTNSEIDCSAIFSPDGILKKADWSKYAQLTDQVLDMNKLDFSNRDKSDFITEAVRVCAQASIPRGKLRKFRPFWTTELTELKKQQQLREDAN
ncbi:hypothetical protein CEXT_66151 [Caerostris extrusa]|uniref:Uncharacterized protein n=1 Tax=Caerostris extrusa TaxID=172846 RepID=A0AAV4V8N3_CAEEX|nr:hypothetical protein CEXT_66151 [Caerostris extrusa]